MVSHMLHIVFTVPLSLADVRVADALVFIFAARCYASAAYVVMRCLSVRLSVCVFVTFVDHVKTNKHVVKLFSPPGSHAILVFPRQTA